MGEVALPGSAQRVAQPVLIVDGAAVDEGPGPIEDEDFGRGAGVESLEELFVEVTR